MENLIRETIKEKGLKITHVIKKLHMSTSSFYEIMNGRSIPNLKTARKISRFLGVSMDVLFPQEAEDDNNA